MIRGGGRPVREIARALLVAQGCGHCRSDQLATSREAIHEDASYVYRLSGFFKPGASPNAENLTHSPPRSSTRVPIARTELTLKPHLAAPAMARRTGGSGF